MSQIKQGLSPMIHPDTEFLILGSLPSDQSLEKQQYYGNKQNDLWALLSLCLNEEELNDRDLSYSRKLTILKEHRIGLWDVFKEAIRPGSLDSQIKSEVLNDFTVLKRKAPGLRKVIFNGKKAGKHEKILRDLGYDTAVVYSSSSQVRYLDKKRKKMWVEALEEK